MDKKGSTVSDKGFWDYAKKAAAAKAKKRPQKATKGK